MSEEMHEVLEVKMIRQDLDLESFRRPFLEALKNELQNGVPELQDELSDGIQKMGDEVEHFTEEREKFLGYRLKGRQSYYYQKVKNALERIEKGTFGICLECDGHIEASRLKARPTAELCINCKEEQEKQDGGFIHKNRRSLLRSYGSGPAVETNSPVVQNKLAS